MYTTRLLIALLIPFASALTGFPSTAHARPPGDPLLARLATISLDTRPVPDITGIAQPVAVHTVAYGRIDGRRIRGYLARPRDAARPMPGVLVIHGWWGLTDRVRAVTRRLAAAGYTALAVDLYADRIAETPAQARFLRDTALRHPARMRHNLRQAFLYLDIMPSTSRLAIIGWCLGGGLALRTALLFPQAVDATVIYYGQLITDTGALQPLTTPVLGHFGATDARIPPARVHRFGESLKKLRIPHELYVYPAAGHGFANPSRGRYVQAAARQAWRRTIEFLARTLAAPTASPPLQSR